MGWGFAILIHLVFLFIVSTVLAIVLAIIIYFTSKNKKKRKVILGVVSPFVFLYTTYFTIIIGSIFISSWKCVDIGVGDAWYVPIANDCQLLFIDLPEQSYIDCEGQQLVYGVEELQQVGDHVYVKTYEGKLMSIDTKDAHVEEALSLEELKEKYNDDFKLVSSWTFYSDRKDELTGGWYKALLFFAFAFSCALLFLIIKLALRVR